MPKIILNFTVMHNQAMTTQMARYFLIIMLMFSGCSKARLQDADMDFNTLLGGGNPDPDPDSDARGVLVEAAAEEEGVAVEDVAAFLDNESTTSSVNSDVSEDGDSVHSERSDRGDEVELEEEKPKESFPRRLYKKIFGDTTKLHLELEGGRIKRSTRTPEKYGYPVKVSNHANTGAYLDKAYDYAFEFLKAGERPQVPKEWKRRTDGNKGKLRQLISGVDLWQTHPLTGKRTSSAEEAKKWYSGNWNFFTRSFWYGDKTDDIVQVRVWVRVDGDPNQGHFHCDFDKSAIDAVVKKSTSKQNTPLAAASTEVLDSLSAAFNDDGNIEVKGNGSFPGLKKLVRIQMDPDVGGAQHFQQSYTQKFTKNISVEPSATEAKVTFQYDGNRKIISLLKGSPAPLGLSLEAKATTISGTDAANNPLWSFPLSLTIENGVPSAADLAKEVTAFVKT